MAFPGGMFKVLDPAMTPNPRDPNARRFYDCIVWGEVIGEAQFVPNSNGSGYYKLGVRWRKKTIAKVYCLRTNPFVYEITRLLKKDDVVVVIGKMQEYEFERKKRIEKLGPIGRYQGIEAMMILPARLMLRGMELLQSGDADKIEGLEEFLKYGESGETPEFGNKEDEE